MIKMLALILLSLAPLAAVVVAQKADADRDLDSLVNSERAFARASLEKSTRDAFLAYLADDSILFRPHPVAGKKYVEENPGPASLLTWEPTFADISASGDLGYTTGPWEIRKERNAGEKPVAYGHFVSVWKRQPDGSWKVAIDTGISHPQPTSAAVFEAPSRGRKVPAAGAKKVDAEAEKRALLKADQEFSARAAGRGARHAFLEYMTSDARLYRMNSYPVMGSGPIQAALPEPAGALTWEPAFADVSKAADLGYTYGLAELKAKDATEYSNYLRVWKKQPGGQWKVALDIFTPTPRQ